jgi:hypothetical protein
MLGYVLVKEEGWRRLQEELAFLQLRVPKFDAEMADLRKLAGEKGRALEPQKEHLVEARARADFAEQIVQLQTASIDRLMASNDRMVDLVASMRRTGFGILEPIETNDEPDTIDGADADAVRADPDLEADDAL